MKPRVAWVAALLALAVGGPSAQARRPLRWSVDLLTGAGATDNVFESESDRRSGLFADLRLQLELGRRSPGFRWEVGLDLDRRWFPDRSLKRGDESDGELSARWQWDLHRDRARPMRVRLKTSASAHRTQLTSRFATGDELIGTGGTSLLHRYDADQLRVDWDVTFGQGRDLSWAIGGTLRRRDYRQDYSDEPAIDSLDHGEMSVDASVEWKVSSRVEWGGRVELGRRGYRERFVRDLSGKIVPGLATRYRDLGLTTDLRFRVSERVRGWFLIGHESRSEGHAGYDDRQRDRALLRWYYEPADRLKLRWTAEAERSTWPRAHVGYDPAKSLRRTWVRRLSFDLELELGRRWSLSAALEAERQDSRSPGYSFDRNVVSVGMTHRWGGGSGGKKARRPERRRSAAPPAASRVTGS